MSNFKDLQEEKIAGFFQKCQVGSEILLRIENSHILDKNWHERFILHQRLLIYQLEIDQMLNVSEKFAIFEIALNWSLIISMAQKLSSYAVKDIQQQSQKHSSLSYQKEHR